MSIEKLMAEKAAKITAHWFGQKRIAIKKALMPNPNQHYSSAKHPRFYHLSSF
jgi:hypothetical protein